MATGVSWRPQFVIIGCRLSICTCYYFGLESYSMTCNYFCCRTGYLLSDREKAILDWGHSIPDGSSQPLWIADSIPHVFIVVYRHLGVCIYSMNSNFDNGR